MKNIFDELKRLENDLYNITQEAAAQRIADIARTVEATRDSGRYRGLFVTGWRPTVGWICGLALGYQFIGRDCLLILLLNFVDNPVLPPELDTSELMALIVSLLGIGGYRTIEKVKGVSR